MKTYHMNRKEKEIKDLDEIKSILRDGKYASLALSKKREPYIVTMNYGFDIENNSLYFHCANLGLKLDFIRENSSVCGTVVEDKGYLGGECDHAYRSVVFWGSMEMIDNLKEKKHGIEVLLNHLEDNPKKLKKKLLRNQSVYNNFTILKLVIQRITGKKGPAD